MTGCGDVCIDMDFDAPVECYSAKVIKARGHHVCGECGETVVPGTRYEKAKGKCEGDWFSAKTCEVCLGVREALVCGSFEFGAMWDTIAELVFPIWQGSGPWDCLVKVETKEAREELLSRFRKWQGATGGVMGDMADQNIQDGMDEISEPSDGYERPEDEIARLEAKVGGMKRQLQDHLQLIERNRVAHEAEVAELKGERDLYRQAFGYVTIGDVTLEIGDDWDVDGGTVLVNDKPAEWSKDLDIAKAVVAARDGDEKSGLLEE